MTEQTRETQMNPEAFDLVIGKKILKTIQVFPLSVGDQLKMSKLVTTIIQKFAAMSETPDGEESDNEWITFILTSITDNLNEIITSITDVEAEIVLNDLTNTQAIELATKVYENNYEFLKKTLEPRMKPFLDKIFKKTEPEVERSTPSPLLQVLPKPMASTLETSSNLGPLGE